MEILGGIPALVVTLSFAWVLDWKAADLVWGLWLSSLIVGSLVMLSQCLHMPLAVLKGSLAERREFTVGQIVLGLAAVLVFNGFVLVFFTLHFGFFHFVHGMILSGVLELEGTEYAGSLWQLPGFAVGLLPKYYGVVIASAFAERKLILRPEGLQRVEQPYKGVIKIHLLVLALLVLHALGAANLVFYAVAFLVYFTPWQELKKGKGESRDTSTPEPGLKRA